MVFNVCHGERTALKGRVGKSERNEERGGERREKRETGSIPVLVLSHLRLYSTEDQHDVRNSYHFGEKGVKRSHLCRQHHGRRLLLLRRRQSHQCIAA